MSTCISSHGEYSSHEPDDEYTCRLCGVLDENAMREELRRLRAGSALDREQIIRTLDFAGAFCGVCGREPGDPLADCDDCRRCLDRYADALLAASPLRTVTVKAEYHGLLSDAEDERDALAARLAAVEALADDLDSRPMRISQALTLTAAMQVADRLRAVLSAAPTDTTKET